MPPGVIQVSNLTLLALLGPSTRVTDGVLAYVQSLKRCFVLDRSGTDAPIAGQVVAASGGGRWRSTSLYSGTAGPWKRVDWHINPTTGSVEGTGSAVSPLSSWRELIARIGGQSLSVGTTISLYGNLPEVIDASTLVPAGSGVVITGQPGATTLLDTTVTAYTGESLLGSGQTPLLTAVGVADWTTHVGRRVRFIDGPAAGYFSHIIVANPSGLGLATARLYQPTSPAYPGPPAYATPAGGNRFVAEALPTAFGYIPPPQNLVILSSIALPFLALTPVTGGRIVLQGSSLDNAALDASELSLQACRLGSATTAAQLNATALELRGFDGWAPVITASYSELDRVVFENGGTFHSGVHVLHRVSAWDNAAGSGIDLDIAGTTLHCRGVVYGSNNVTTGIRLANPGNLLCYDPTALPIITGGLGDFWIAGALHTWLTDTPLMALNLSGVLTQ